MTSNPMTPFVRRLAARNALEPTELLALADLRGQLERIDRGRDFMRLGHGVDYACLIVSGFVARFQQSRNGDRQITSLHFPGEIANLCSVVLPRATSALQALTGTTILKIPRADIRAVSDRYPSVARALWQESVVNASILSEWLVNIGRRDAVASTAHLLAELAWRQGHERPQDGMSFDFRATQQHIADALGLTSVHVNRMLRVLRDENILTLASQRLTIHDWQALVAIGEFNPDYLFPELDAAGAG